MTTMIAESTIVLVGLESVGKSALFRALSGKATPDEANFRGSTVRVRSVLLPERLQRLVDTPGLRVQDDSITTGLALEEVRVADTVVLVACGTHVHQEVATLLAQVGVTLQGHKVALVITFADRVPSALQQVVQHYEAQLGIPVALVNAREMTPEQHQRLLTVIDQATPPATPPMNRAPIFLLPPSPVVNPQPTPGTSMARPLARALGAGFALCCSGLPGLLSGGSGAAGGRCDYPVGDGVAADRRTGAIAFCHARRRLWRVDTRLVFLSLGLSRRSLH